MTSPQADVYAREQQAAVIAAVAAAGVAAGMAGPQLANFTFFMAFLRAIWPAVLGGRRRAAWSARQFFDRERARVTGLPQLDVPLLPDYRFEWFVKDMRPAYETAVKQLRVERESENRGIPVPSAKIESTVRVVVAKVVADAGRDEIIQAVEMDQKNLRESRREAAQIRDGIIDLDAPKRPAPRWARIATGNETCGWCTMLVSRGPVYRTKESAGDSKKFHAGCDCLVVPVFKDEDWFGMEQVGPALEQWKIASRAASRIVKAMPDNVYKQKHGSGFRDVTLTDVEAQQRETVKVLRVIAEGGDVDAYVEKRLEQARKKSQKELARR